MINLSFQRRFALAGISTIPNSLQSTISVISPRAKSAAKNSIAGARSTVGTHTEINDYLRLLFSRIGITHCSSCGKIVSKDITVDIVKKIEAIPIGQKIIITFPITFDAVSASRFGEYIRIIKKQGFRKLYIDGNVCDIDETIIKKRFNNAWKIDVVVDRLICGEYSKSRLLDSLEAAYDYGKDHLSVIVFSDNKNKR